MYRSIHYEHNHYDHVMGICFLNDDSIIGPTTHAYKLQRRPIDFSVILYTSLIQIFMLNDSESRSGSDPLPIGFVLGKRLWVSWFPRPRFCGRCRNIEFTMTKRLRKNRILKRINKQWPGAPISMRQWCISPCFRIHPISEKFLWLRDKFSRFGFCHKKIRCSDDFLLVITRKFEIFPLVFSVHSPISGNFFVPPAFPNSPQIS